MLVGQRSFARNRSRKRGGGNRGKERGDVAIQAWLFQCSTCSGIPVAKLSQGSVPDMNGQLKSGSNICETERLLMVWPEAWAGMHQPNFRY